MATTCEVTATALNLRAAPNATSTVVAVLRRGQVCVASGEPADGWIPVVFDRYAGFVGASFLRPVGDRPAAAATGGAATPARPVQPAADPDAKQRDPAQLHPLFRAALGKLLALTAQEGIPFRTFEAFRTPERQEWLYAQGRTRPGAIVTKARAWQSFHQFGLGADLVLFIEGKWTWSDAGALRNHWKRLPELAAQVGLRTLSWEAPHVEWPVSTAEATAAPMLSTGDESWLETLQIASSRWRHAGLKGAPDLGSAERPPL